MRFQPQTHKYSFRHLKTLKSQNFLIFEKLISSASFSYFILCLYLKQKKDTDTFRSALAFVIKEPDSKTNITGGEGYF